MNTFYIIGRASTSLKSKVATQDFRNGEDGCTSNHLRYDTLEEAVEVASQRSGADREVWVVYEAIRVVKPKFDVSVVQLTNYEDPPK